MPWHFTFLHLKGLGIILDTLTTFHLKKVTTCTKIGPKNPRIFQHLSTFNISETLQENTLGSILLGQTPTASGVEPVKRRFRRTVVTSRAGGNPVKPGCGLGNLFNILMYSIIFTPEGGGTKARQSGLMASFWRAAVYFRKKKMVRRWNGAIFWIPCALAEEFSLRKNFLCLLVLFFCPACCAWGPSCLWGG